MRKILLTGQRFGRLLVGAEAPPTNTGAVQWHCECACGTSIITTTLLLRRGGINSCGCLRRELGVKRGRASRKHGESSNGGSNSPEYQAWAQMLTRCRNPSDVRFPHYGGRGVKVCERWQSFELFLIDMGRRPNKDHSLDRINNEGNYEPGNVRWATSVTQNRNTRSNRWVTVRGTRKLLVEWLVLVRVSRQTFYERLRTGMTEEQALFTGARKKNGEPQDEAEHARLQHLLASL